MALYAFDGTWNTNEPDEGADTNVVKFAEAYTQETCYRPGVGTRMGKLGKVLGGVFGAGAERRLDEMMAELRQNVLAGDTTIDVIGFSRGAALALEFVNLVNKEMQATPIRFLGLWDTVASFGMPGNEVNIGHELTLSDNVEHCFHAMSLDERRGNFPLTRVVPRKHGKPAAGRVEEVWFRGVHSDVGGGQCIGLSSIALVWMLRRGLRCGLPIDPAELPRHDGIRDARAPISKSFDPKADPKRAIADSDFVHESVTPRGHANGKAHNDPPPACRVATDA